MKLIVCALSLVCLLGVTSCGVKGDPIPYVSTLPDATSAPQNTEERKKP